MRLPRSLDSLTGLRAVRWIRESTRGQWDNFGPDAQREQQDRAIERYGLVDTGIAWQVAHSGFKKDRQGEVLIASTDQWIDMLARAGQDFDVLVVGYVSRFARDARTALNARHDLHQAGAAILFADERLLTSDEDRWGEWYRETGEAEEYSRRLAKRIREGYASKRRRFADPGGLVPHGFRRGGDRHLVEPDPATMPQAVEVYRRAAAGELDADIAAAVGLSLWTVRGILRSTMYAGRLPDGTPTRFPAPVPPDVCERAWAERERRTYSGHATHRNRVYPLTNRGPLTCERCGRFLKGAFRIPRDEPVYRHPDVCDGWRWADTPAVLLDAQVGAMLTGAAPNRESEARIRAALRAPVTMPDRLALARIDGRLRSLALELATPHPARDPREIVEELEAVREQRRQVETTPVEAETADPDDALDWLASLGMLWQDTSEVGKRELAVAIFARLGAVDRRVVSVEATPDAERRGLVLALPAALDVTMVGDTGLAPTVVTTWRPLTRSWRLKVARRGEWLSLARARSA